MELRGERRDLIPGGMQRHLQAGSREQLLVVERHRALAVERERIKAAVVRQPEPNLRHDVVEVVRLLRGWAESREVGVDAREPLVLRPDRYVVRPDGDDVELSATRRHVARHLLTKR